MKTIKLIFVAVVVFVTLGVTGWGQELEAEGSNSGKIIGQIIDPETGEPVNEVFNISLSEVNPIKKERPRWYSFDSNKNGRFVFKIIPNDYYITLLPELSSKYCSDDFSSHVTSPKNTQVVKIQKGKITKIIKRATIGGSLKLILVDQNHQPLNIKETFKKERVDAINLKREIDNKQCGSGTFETNERIFNQLMPGLYTIEFATYPHDEDIIFFWITMQKGVLVEKGKMTTVNYPVYIDSGLEGKIIWNNGVKFELIAYMNKHDRNDYDIAFFPDQNGNFKILNLEEGAYDIEFIVNTAIGKNVSIHFKNIFIPKGNIIRKDFNIDLVGK